MEVYDFLMENSDVVLEIGGHTNNRPTEEFAQTLSTSRAKSVADWLISKGIPSDRVQYKGYGKKYPIETNATLEGRRKNQRVEIKILSMNG
jgi:outer membrane protein OmpA-like peptidoglycan-associated protein